MPIVESKKEIISFRADVLPSTKIELSERVKADATIDEIRMRFYVGQQLSLEVYPFVKHKGNKVESFFTFANGTKSVISGDDDYFVFPISIPCEYDDEIHLAVQNKDAVNTYTVTVDVVVDYLGGKARVV